MKGGRLSGRYLHFWCVRIQDERALCVETRRGLMRLFMIPMSFGLVLCACQHPDPTTSGPTATALAPAATPPPNVAAAPAFIARQLCAPQSDDAFFFPVASLGDSKPHFDADLFRRHWYSRHLRRMAEPSLSCGEALVDVFRFTWLRTFHQPITIRVSATRNSAKLAATRLSGAGGYEPGAIVEQPHRELSPDEWRSLQDALAKAEFWALPSWRREDAGMDGARWIVEGRVSTRYHVVDRWTPDSGSFQDLGLLFIKLSRLSVPEKDVY